MPISVHAYTTYLRGDFRMRNEDYSGQKIVKALKGETFKGYAVAEIRGRNVRIDSGNQQRAIRIWSRWAADRILAMGLQNCVLAPIPNTCALVGAPATFGTLGMAQALARELGQSALVHDALRWTAATETARSGGGTRRPGQLYDNLTYIPAEHSHPYILVDDVVTSGGHVKACRAVLEEHGKTVSLAICGARTVYEQLNRVFDLPPFEIEDFDPSDPDGLRALFQSLE